MAKDEERHDRLEREALQESNAWSNRRIVRHLGAISEREKHQDDSDTVAERMMHLVDKHRLFFVVVGYHVEPPL